MNRNHILFIVNGLGLGNAVRCSKLIEECIGNGYRVSVAASGNAFEWFNVYFQQIKLIELKQPEYPKSIFGCLKALSQFISATYKNRITILRLISQLSPSSVVIDSFYGITRYDLAVPLIAINNSDYVVSNFIRKEVWRWRAMLHFLFVECVDAIFHRMAATTIISPNFECEKLSTDGRFIYVPPLIRSAKDINVEKLLKKDSTRLNVCVLLSGSSMLYFDPNEYLNLPICFHIIGKDGAASSNEIYYGKVRNPLPLLIDADLLIIGGGFLSCAEAFSLSKPIIVMPLPWHAEQVVNASKLCELSGSIVADKKTLKDALNVMVSNLNDKPKWAVHKQSHEAFNSGLVAQILTFS